jgi:hypothetical protein
VTLLGHTYRVEPSLTSTSAAAFLRAVHTDGKTGLGSRPKVASKMEIKTPDVVQWVQLTGLRLVIESVHHRRASIPKSRRQREQGFLARLCADKSVFLFGQAPQASQDSRTVSADRPIAQSPKSSVFGVAEVFTF